MASTYSTSLKIQLIGTGEQSGIWGSTTNTNWNLIEQAVAGVQTIVMANANYTLSNLNGVSCEARNIVIVATGTNSDVRQIVAPLVSKTYIITNSTTGGFAVTIGGATGAVVSIPNGYTAQVYCDGTNFYSAQTTSAGNFSTTGNLVVAGTSTLTGNVAITSTLTVGGVNVESFASGTTLLFYQAAAPTGWTQVTTQDDAALRVVSTAGGGSGGSVGFTTAFASQAVTGTTDSHVLTTAEIPAHTHGITDPTHNHGVNDPSHTHGVNGYINANAGGAGDSYGTTHNEGGSIYNAYTGISLSAAATGISVNANTGGDGGHTHTFTGNPINLAVKYINVIMCSKN